MKDKKSITELVRLSFDSSKPSLTIESDWLIILSILILLVIAYIIKRNFSKLFNWYEMEVEISGSPKLKFKVERNHENLFIANRIYIELTTRKAAIPIDENTDVIEEIYDSWYKLFGIIREEIKSVPGNYLKEHDATAALIGLTRKILNDAMRPHLNEYRAKFRKWLEVEKGDPINKTLSPQNLQKKYPDFDNLVASMKLVNNTLTEYAEQLDKLIKGK
jgi:hypothetical protein